MTPQQGVSSKQAAQKGTQGKGSVPGEGHRHRRFVRVPMQKRVGGTPPDGWNVYEKWKKSAPPWRQAAVHTTRPEKLECVLLALQTSSVRRHVLRS